MCSWFKLLIVHSQPQVTRGNVRAPNRALRTDWCLPLVFSCHVFILIVDFCHKEKASVKSCLRQYVLSFLLGVGLSQLIEVTFICNYLLEITPGNYLLISVICPVPVTFLTKYVLLLTYFWNAIIIYGCLKFKCISP